MFSDAGLGGVRSVLLLEVLSDGFMPCAMSEGGVALGSWAASVTGGAGRAGARESCGTG